MEFIQYITDNAIVLVAPLGIIGAMIKKTPNIPDWIIPWILLAFGMLGGIAIVGFNIDGIIQGILVAGVTVFGNQLIKQTSSRE